MSKKKNTLKDLDEFLKQQAATLVAPEKLSERLEVASGPATTEAAVPDPLKSILKNEGLSVFCEAILASLPAGAHPTEDEILLINTALYIKGGNRWQEVVKEYWSKA
jgi:hypothetical protein